MALISELETDTVLIGQWPYRRFPTTTSGCPTCDCERTCFFQWAPQVHQIYFHRDKQHSLLACLAMHEGIWPHVACLHLHHITRTPCLTSVTTFHLVSHQFFTSLYNVLIRFMHVRAFFFSIHSCKAATKIKLTANDHWKGCRLRVLRKPIADPGISHGNPRASLGPKLQQRKRAAKYQRLSDTKYVRYLVIYDHNITMYKTCKINVIIVICVHSYVYIIICSYENIIQYEPIWCIIYIYI